MTKRKHILKTIAHYAKKTNQKLVIKEGANHTRIWVGDRYTTIARHSEIDDLMAQKIYKQIGIK
ncbi:toxin HicA [Corynebacterium matruchotii]|uniref:toxin HicA n=1 Tax=Corynebacterium matruchotii TaxID=43768 RepID=UPI00288B5D36|nr:toxin HicA [Corynebacterium matruchotii]